MERLQSVSMKQLPGSVGVQPQIKRNSRGNNLIKPVLVSKTTKVIVNINSSLLAQMLKFYKRGFFYLSGTNIIMAVAVKGLLIA